MSLDQLLAQHPLEQVRDNAICYEYRSSGQGPALVLLHGIGSASATWVHQLTELSNEFHVLAWNAPGYGNSTALPSDWPAARDYGHRMWAWLDVLGLSQVMLVGHSLGALMAAAAARLRPQRVRRLVLLSPAIGYAQALPALRTDKLNKRLTTLAQLGPTGMAIHRAPAMLSPTAATSDIAFVQTQMAQINTGGYTQAARMLANADIRSELMQLPITAHVASAGADDITPAIACAQLACELGAPYTDLGPAGHSCMLEAAATVNTLLRSLAGAQR